MNQTLFKSINEENIELLVRRFYPEVLKNTTLAPFFTEALGQDIHSEKWEEHLLLLTEFWKFVALGYDEYNGNPLEPHTHLNGLSREAFEQWLSLFHQTVDKCYIPSTGEYFKQKSSDIAGNFMRRLNI